MKRRITVLFSFIAALVIFMACNNDDNNGGTNPIIGTWKLVEHYRNGSQVALSGCNMEETYIFGPEQFTHEYYENSGGRFASPYKNVNDSDDDEGSDDEESDDEESDDSSDDVQTDDVTTDDTQTDDSSDDSSDDNGSGGSGGTCVNTERIIGTWTSSSSVYSLTEEGVTQVVTITFLDANNRFYIETTTTVNGTTVVHRYVYQKQ